MEHARVFKSSFNRPNLFYEIRPKVNTEKQIIKYIKDNSGKSGIIYCLSRKKVEEMAELLNINGIKALPYHAGLDAATRAANQDKFLMEDVDVIVATIAFGMGIDKPDVRFVIHYNMPKSLEGYYQETGRAGRDGGEGKCIAFFSQKDIDKLEKFMQNKPVSEQEIGKQLLNDTVAYAESNQCRRKVLLHYFGEEYENDNCGCCDNCVNPPAHFPGQEFVTIVLKLVNGMKENFKSDHLANILGGINNSIIKSYNHNKSEYFGIIPGRDAKFWLAAIRQCTIGGFLFKDIEQYGLISITEKGRNFLKDPYPIELTEDRTYENTDDDSDSIDSGLKHHPAEGAGDETLFALLKETRHSLSKRLKLPPFVIFSDPSLEDMATLYPITMEELKNCQGVGEGKARKFGKEFLELIAKYVEENEIDRPTEFIIKNVGHKSLNKVFIIQSIDRRMPLDEIADAKNMDMDELYTEIETIVNSGTRINIDYYIHQIVDEDKINDIYDYFKEEATSDSLNEAMKALGVDYSEEEIRLIRIKFMSELGN
jgi:ATP-dependent DNA helicase RecQ